MAAYTVAPMEVSFAAVGSAVIATALMATAHFVGVVTAKLRREIK